MITESSEVSKITQTIALLLVKHHRYIGKTLWLKILHSLAMEHRDINFKLTRMCLPSWLALIVQGMGKKTSMVLTDHWPCTLQYIPNRQCTQYCSTAKHNYLFILPFLVSSTNVKHAVVGFLHFFCSFCQGINHNINMKDCDPYQSNKETFPQNLLLCLW